MSEPRPRELISDPLDAQTWVAFTLGACVQACFAEQDSPGRTLRSRWAGHTMHILFRAVIAAFVVARNHPEEFKAALGEPIEVEPMP